jgi:AAA family ATP:ADP antiporter
MGDASLLIAACIYFRDNEKLKQELDLEKHLSTLAQHFLVDFKDSTESSQKFHILKAIAFGRFSNLYHHIDEYLSSKVEEERRIALEASCFTLTRSYANKLIEALQDPVYEKTATNALLFYGEALMVIGHDVLSSKVLKNKAKAKFIGIFSGLGSQNVVNFLLDLLNQKSLRLRKEALTQLNIMKSKYKNLDFNKEMIYRRVEKEVRQIKSLLPHYFTLQHAFLDSNDLEKSEFLSSKKKVLRRSYMLLRKRFVTIFLLLGLEYEKKDVFDIYTGLMSKDELKRSYSLEFMEMFVDYKYGKILSPLLEVIILKKPSVEELAKLGIKLTTIELALVKMINYPDEKLQIAFLNLFEHKEMNQFSAVLNTPIKVKNQLIADRLERLRKQEIDKVY